MNDLTQAQQSTLAQMQGFRVIARLDSGEALVVFSLQYQEARIIDVNGHVYAISHYLSLLDHRPRVAVPH